MTVTEAAVLFCCEWWLTWHVVLWRTWGDIAGGGPSWCRVPVAVVVNAGDGHQAIIGELGMTVGVVVEIWWP